jgi:predicted PurR-regulated permease PerM
MEFLQPLIQHPLANTLLTSFLLGAGLARIYWRVGLNPLWALLIFSSMIVPFSGPFLALLPLTIKKWPRFPKAAPAAKPIKTPI